MAQPQMTRELVGLEDGNTFVAVPGVVGAVVMTIVGCGLNFMHILKFDE